VKSHQKHQQATMVTGMQCSRTKSTEVCTSDKKPSTEWVRYHKLVSEVKVGCCDINQQHTGFVALKLEQTVNSFKVRTVLHVSIASDHCINIIHNYSQNWLCALYRSEVILKGTQE